jgi:hypothetical protein
MKQSRSARREEKEQGVELLDIVRRSLVDFCCTFVKHPYLCYTEHGQHALFYTLLYNALSPEQRYTTWQGQKIGVIQKEYPTAGDLSKSRRQHWDIAVLKTPPESLTTECAYDYLKLAAVIEFGMNARKKHLVEDLRRLCHADANLMQGFVVHLYRLSQPPALFSKRDWTSGSKRILSPKEVAEIVADKPVEVYYALTDGTGQYTPGVWRMRNGIVTTLSDNDASAGESRTQTQRTGLEPDTTIG